MVRSLIGVVAGASLVLTVAGAASDQHKPARSGMSLQAHSRHLYYDISEDPQSLELLALGDSGKVGGAMMLDVTDVFRRPDFLLGNTWRIECGAEHMSVVHTTPVEPGSAPQAIGPTVPSIAARASDKSWRMYQLACTGRGQLEERRVYHGELIDIVKRFWAAG